jgi:hypothetical protein
VSQNGNPYEDRPSQKISEMKMTRWDDGNEKKKQNIHLTHVNKKEHATEQ